MSEICRLAVEDWIANLKLSGAVIPDEGALRARELAAYGVGATATGQPDLFTEAP